MKIGIIGYGSMGRMLTEKFLGSEKIAASDLYLSNRTLEKISNLVRKCNVCESNSELASKAEIIFLCVRPLDLKSVLEEIREKVRPTSLLVSLNGSVLFSQIEKICCCKTAKMIPSITAEVNRSQTLVCYNNLVSEKDKEALLELTEILGDTIELPESELGMGAELTSCMPGFIAAIFQEIASSAQKHTSIPPEKIIRMLLTTMTATGSLMLEKSYSFERLVSRVATKGGITEEGVKVISGHLPAAMDELFARTLDKRRATTQAAQKSFAEESF